MELLITVLVIFVIAFLAIYLINMVGLPDPLNWISKGIVAIIAIVALLNFI